MAIRKFRKNMKAVSVVLTIVFILSLVYTGYSSMKVNRANKKAQEAFRINGQYIQKVEIERTKNQIAESFARYNQNQKVNIDQEVLSTLAVNSVIEKQLSKKIAKNLGIKVSSSEVDKTYSDLEKNIGDKDQFKRMLKARGHSVDSFKEEIESQLLMQKLIDQLVENEKVDENEVDDYFASISLVNPQVTKEFVEKQIKTQQANLKYKELLHSLKKEMKLNEIAPEYEKFLEKEETNIDGISISNVDMADIIANMSTADLSLEELKENAKKFLEQQLKIVKLAKENNINIEEDIPYQNLVIKYEDALREKIKSNIKYSDEDLKAFFKENKAMYDTKETAGAQILIFKISPTKEDEEIAKEKALAILKSVNTKNFTEKAKELSKKDGYIYEELGTFLKGQMVKEFEDAVAKTPAGEIYKDVVKTPYGYHIINVLSNEDGKYNANHILVRVSISDKTYKDKLDAANKIVEDLQKGSVNFEEVAKNNENVVANQTIPVITRAYPLNIPNGGEISTDILNSNVGDIKLASIDKDTILIFKKINEQKYKEANYEEVKTRVKENFINYKINEYLINNLK